MGVRTRTFDMIAAMRREAADRAKREDAARVVERWNKTIAAGRDIWWSPTIRAAIVAGMPWADVDCPGCRTSRAIDLRTIDRHPLASVGSLVLGMRCTWCSGAAPMPKITGLHAMPPVRGAGEPGIRRYRFSALSFVIPMFRNDRRPHRIDRRLDRSLIQRGKKPALVAPLNRG